MIIFTGFSAAVSEVSSAFSKLMRMMVRVFTETV